MKRYSVWKRKRGTGGKGQPFQLWDVWRDSCGHVQRFPASMRRQALQFVQLGNRALESHSGWEYGVTEESPTQDNKDTRRWIV